MIKILKKCDKKANRYVVKMIRKISRLQGLEGRFNIRKYDWYTLGLVIKEHCLQEYLSRLRNAKERRY